MEMDVMEARESMYVCMYVMESGWILLCLYAGKVLNLYEILDLT